MSRRALLALTLPLLLGAKDSSTPPVPWPYGLPPSAAQIDELVAEAHKLDARETAEEFLAASERGEDSEHLVILQSRIDKGEYTKEQLFQFGDELFSHEFTFDNGYGDRASRSHKRVHAGVRGGLDTFSCAGCHSVGGPDGAGGPTQNAFLEGDGTRYTSANIRNPPALLGLGLIQALAAEMSADLQKLRADAIEKAKSTGEAVTVALVSKGVSFGAIVVQPDRRIDYAKLQGVNIDLVVRPFGWKGTGARLRRFVEDAARVHFGIQSQVLVAAHQHRPDPAHLGEGPNWWDPDDDGKQVELEEGLLTAAACYLAMLEAPVILPPHDQGLRARWANGSRLFDAIGCAGCHTRQLPLRSHVWRETADSTQGAVEIKLFEDGDMPKGGPLVQLFSDLKRHDLGPKLADPHENEHRIPRSVFLTRPLWGLAESAPYLHDGSAATIPEAILAHGGEAQGARDAFARLSRDERADVHVFLLSLTREPKPRVGR